MCWLLSYYNYIEHVLAIILLHSYIYGTFTDCYADKEHLCQTCLLT